MNLKDINRHEWVWDYYDESVANTRHFLGVYTTVYKHVDLDDQILGYHSSNRRIQLYSSDLTSEQIANANE
jgi:hypothetical protein